MTEEEKIRRAKELAAVAAFEAYATTLREHLDAAGLPLTVLDETVHVHAAVVLDGEHACAIACRWQFSTDPTLLAGLVAQKHQGSG